MIKTIAIDFDGVIHKYSKGWNDGTIYDEPFESAFDSIKELMEDCNVFIFSTRSPRQIKKWLHNKLYVDNSSYTTDGQTHLFDYYEINFQIIPFWKKFWDKKGVLGITNKKLPAYIYIDDRGYKFKSWGDLKEIKKELGLDYVLKTESYTDIFNGNTRIETKFYRIKRSFSDLLSEIIN